MAVPHRRTIRSFVRREGRLTNAQREALQTLWPQYGIDDQSAWQDYLSVLASRPVVLDIGFGNGEALLQLGLQYPQIQFVGIEVYRPGIGNLLRLLAVNQLSNVRIICADAVEILQHWMAADSLHGCTLWFPDPWPKTRHHKRRLVNEAFVELLASRLRPKGLLHIATDWPDYADWIDALMATKTNFVPIRSALHPLKLHRPQTKFERRGLRQGNPARDFVYCLKGSA